jgi:ribonuclease R
LKKKQTEPSRGKSLRGETPTKDAILDYLSKNPGNTTVRDVARAFSIKGSARIGLKQTIKQLESEGVIERGRGRKFTRAGDLPEITVIEVNDQDPDGELLGRPVDWTRDEDPPQIFIAPGEGRGGESGPAIGVGDRILARLAKQPNGAYEARLVRRLGQSAHKILGVAARAGGQMRIRPVDRRSKLELVIDKGQEGGARDGELVLVDPLPGRAHGLPRGKVKERLGLIGSPGVISLIAVHTHGIPTDFSEAAIAEAESAKPATMKGREDLRALPLITIDPSDARDHDDAVWAAADDDPGNKGGFAIVIAIADVAYYVRPGSALDRDALRRGNSAYFPDRVEPMLPERLSNDLCSLKEKVERPCLAVRIVFDAQGRKRSQKFMRAMMRSAARLTYSQVQAAIDGKPDDATRPILDPILRPLWSAYQKLAEARDKRSPLDLDIPEHRIKLDESGRVVSINLRERLESMRLIEEFMIQANVAAAEVLEQKRTPLVYRIHDQPSREKLESYGQVLNSINMSFAKGQVLRPAAFNRILERVKDGPHTEMINEVTLRTQAQAEYNVENIGHFGLNLRRYAHFTSPIRRYADLIVHRALIRALGLGEDGLPDSQIERLTQIAADITAHERRAMAAERDSVDRYLAAYMVDRLGAEFPARVTGVTRFGLFVRLNETGANGLIPVRTLGNEYFQHDEGVHALVGERSGTTYRLGEAVTVRLAEAAPVTGGLRFELIEGGSEGKRPERNRRDRREHFARGQRRQPRPGRAREMRRKQSD